MATKTPNFNFELVKFDTQPWHKKEHDNWRLIDALLVRYLAITNVVGVWLNATVYTVGQRTVDPELSTMWECLVTHTSDSTTTFATDRTNNSTYWKSFTTEVAYQGAWVVGTDYKINDYIYDSNRYGIVSISHTSITSYDQGVLDGNILTLIDLSTDLASAAASAAAAAISATSIALPTIVANQMIIGNAGATAWEALAGINLRDIAGLTPANGGVIVGNGTGFVQEIGTTLRSSIGLIIGTDILGVANNLSDVANAATALSNIGGIGAATVDTLTNKTVDANGTGNVLSNIDIANCIAASQAEAEAGTDNTKILTALRVKQAIAALAGGKVTPLRATSAVDTVLATQATGGTQVFDFGSQTVPANGSIDIYIPQIEFDETSSLAQGTAGFGVKIGTDAVVWSTQTISGTTSYYPRLLIGSGLVGIKTNSGIAVSGRKLSFSLDIAGAGMSTGTQNISVYAGDGVNGATGTITITGTTYLAVASCNIVDRT